MRIFILIVIGIGYSLSESRAQSMQIPPPVDLQIQNIPQDTDMWCWAAVAQQIIYRINGNAPYQCQLVAAAKQGNPTICCSNPLLCRVPGNLQDIQRLILA